MTTIATHPMQLDGHPRRWYLATSLALPVTAIVLISVAIWCWISALEFVTTETRSPLQAELSASAVASSDRLFFAGVTMMVLAVTCIAARVALRRRAWWSINPVHADSGAEPDWIGTTLTVARLVTQAGLLGYIALRPSLVGAFFVGVVAIAPTIRPLSDFIARLLVHKGRERAEGQHNRWLAVAEWSIVVAALAVSWLQGDPLWVYLGADLVRSLLLFSWGIMVAGSVFVRVLVATWPEPRRSVA